MYLLLTEIVFPLVMFIIMLGMGLSLAGRDFRVLLHQPMAVLLGVCGQMILLPLVALSVTQILPVTPSAAVGVILLAACPGGITSNAIAFAARADIALSISLTALSSIMVAFTLPLWVNFGIEQHFGENTDVSLPLEKTAVSLGLITLLPVTIGMTARRLCPSMARASAPHFRKFSIAGILFMCVTSTYYNRVLLQNINLVLEVLLASLVMLGSTMGIGYGLSRLCALSPAQGLSIVIEIGVQNIAMVMLVALGMLKNPDIAVVPVVYGIAMLLLSWIFTRVFACHRETDGQLSAPRESGIQQ